MQRSCELSVYPVDFPTDNYETLCLCVSVFRLMCLCVQINVSLCLI